MKTYMSSLRLFALLCVLILSSSVMHSQNLTVTYKTLTDGCFVDSATVKTFTSLSSGDAIPIAYGIIPADGYAFDSWQLIKGTEGTSSTMGSDSLIYEAQYASGVDFSTAIWESNGVLDTLSGVNYYFPIRLAASGATSISTGYAVFTLEEIDKDESFGSKVVEFSSTAIEGATENKVSADTITFDDISLTGGSYKQPTITMQMESSYKPDGTPPDYQVRIKVDLYENNTMSTLLSSSSIVVSNEVKPIVSSVYVYAARGSWTPDETYAIVNLGREDTNRPDTLPDNCTAVAKFQLFYQNYTTYGATPIYDAYALFTVPEYGVFDPAVNSGEWSYVSGGEAIGDGLYQSTTSNPVYVKYTPVSSQLSDDGTLITNNYGLSRTIVDDQPLKLKFPGAPMGTSYEYTLSGQLVGRYQQDLSGTERVLSEDSIVFTIQEDQPQYGELTKRVYQVDDVSRNDGSRTIDDLEYEKNYLGFYYKIGINNNSVVNDSMKNVVLTDFGKDTRLNYKRVCVYYTNSDGVSSSLAGDNEVDLEYTTDGTSWTAFKQGRTPISEGLIETDYDNATFVWDSIPDGVEVQKIRINTTANTTLPASTTLKAIVHCVLPDSLMGDNALYVLGGDTILENSVEATAKWVDDDNDASNDLDAIGVYPDDAYYNIQSPIFNTRMQISGPSTVQDGNETSEFSMHYTCEMGSYENVKFIVTVAAGTEFVNSSIRVEYQSEYYTIPSDFINNSDSSAREPIDNLDYDIINNWKGTDSTALVINLGDIDKIYYDKKLAEFTRRMGFFFKLKGVRSIGASSQEEIVTAYVSYNNDNNNIVPDDLGQAYTDVLDIDNDNNYTEDCFLIEELKITRARTLGLYVSKEGKGSEDISYSESSTSFPGDTLAYRLKIVNNNEVSSTPYKDLKLIDVLPHNNDQHLLPNESGNYTTRGSEFGTPLVGPVIVSIDGSSSLAASDFTIYYTTSTIPTFSVSNPVGSFVENVGLWNTETSVSNWAEVTALKIVSNSGVLIPSGVTISMDYNVTIPLDESIVSKQSINTFAYTTDGMPSYLETDDMFNTIVRTGVVGRAFLDANNDGIMDDGEIPLPGIKATLQKLDGSIWTSASAMDVSDSKVELVTDANGVYNFKIFASGTYRVIFSEEAAELGLSTHDNSTDQSSRATVISDANTSDEFTVSSSSDIVYRYVGFVTDKYWVNYLAPDADSGTVPVSTLHSENDNITVEGSGSLSRVGYVFTEWISDFDSDADTKNDTLQAGSTFIMPAQNVNLTALWTFSIPTAISHYDTIDEDTDSIGSILSDSLLVGTFDANGDSLFIGGVCSGNDCLTPNHDADNTNDTLETNYGELVVMPEGGYTYHIDTLAADTLSADESLVDTFIFTVSDGNGGLVQDTLFITIIGENDVPTVITHYDSIYESNDSIGQLDSLLQGSFDIDGDVLSVDSLLASTDTSLVSDTLYLNYGKLVANADGNYSYLIDTTDARIDSLQDGEFVMDTAIYYVSDLNDGVAFDTLFLTIIGENDVPTLITHYDSIYESNDSIGQLDSLLQGSLDIDGDVLSVDSLLASTDTSLVGDTLYLNYGKLVATVDGNYSYLIDTTDTRIDSLQDGEFVMDTAIYYVSDDNYGVAFDTLFLTIIGENDVPTAITHYNTIYVDNDSIGSILSDSLLVGAEDIDGDSIFIDLVCSGSDCKTPDHDINTNDTLTTEYGQLVVMPEGGYTYHIDTLTADTLSSVESLVDTFIFTVSDGNGGLAQDTLFITIRGENKAPTVISHYDTIYESTDSIGDILSDSLLVGANDIDGDSIFVSEICSDADCIVPNHTTNDTIDTDYAQLVVMPEGGYTYHIDTLAADTLAAGESLVDTFIFTVSDGNGGLAQDTLFITIRGENKAPTAISHYDTIYESTDCIGDILSDSLLVGAEDIDGDSIFISEICSGTDCMVPNHTTNDTIDTNYGQLVVIPEGGYTYHIDTLTADTLSHNESLVDTFIFTVSDGNGGLVQDSLFITIIGENDAPVAYNDTLISPEDSTGLEGNLPPALDVDLGDTLTYSVQNPTDSLVIDTDGLFEYSTPEGYDTLSVGDTVFIEVPYIVTDSIGATDTAILVIIIPGRNDDPIAYNDTLISPEDSTINGNLPPATEIDTGDTLTYSVQDPTDSLVINPDGSFEYTTPEGYDTLSVGDTAFIEVPYLVTDGIVTDTAILVIIIPGRNDDPVAYNDTLLAPEDSTNLEGHLPPATDVDLGDTLTYSLQDPIDSLVIDPDGSFEYTTPEGYDTLSVGDTVFIEVPYIVTDSIGAKDTAILVIIIPGRNDDPIAFNDTLISPEDSIISDKLPLATEIDTGDTLIYSVQDPTDGLVINPDGSYDYTTPEGYDTLAVGDTAFIEVPYLVTDGITTDTAILVIIIPGRDNELIAYPDTLISSPDSTVEGQLPLPENGDSVTYSVETPPDGLVVNPDGSIDYTTPASYDSLTDGDTVIIKVPYVVTDTVNGNNATDTLYIIIPGRNDDPVAVSDTVIISEAVSVTIPVLDRDYDVDGDSLVVDLPAGIEQPSNGTVSFNLDGDSVIYTPGDDFDGRDSFEYVISDGHGGFDTATVIVELVFNTNPPIAIDDIDSCLRGESITFQILDNDTSDLQFDPKTIDLDVTTPGIQDSITVEGGTFTVDSTGLVTFTPEEGFTGNVPPFLYDVCDNHGQPVSKQAAIIITVIDIPHVVRYDANGGEDTPDSAYYYENKEVTVSDSIPFKAGYQFDGWISSYDDLLYVGDEYFDMPYANVTLVAKWIEVDLFVPEIFTPNGDLIHDFLNLPWIANYSGGVDIEVYNRWGDMVYHESNYSNDWYGTCNTGIANGEQLPDGTYFYIIGVPNQSKKLQGYIYITK